MKISDSRGKITSEHLKRMACVYVRQSSPEQVKSNTESARRQYELADRAVEMGWSTGQVRVIDEDQGQSGSLPNSRRGFLGMVASVVRGEVGIVIGLEISRLARNSPDWSHLLYMCRWTSTLIADEHGVYDPADSSDRMVLGVRGQISELERDNAVHRMVEARWNKARRGELHYAPPAGYDLDDLDQLVMSSDESIIDAIRTVFRKFEELGTARQVLVWWREQGRPFPVRIQNGRSHPVEWREVKYGMVLRTLKHPIYAGAYVFGRSETVRKLDPEDPTCRLRTRRIQRVEWPVLIQDHHEAYIPFRKYVENQERIRGNAVMTHGSQNSEASPAREGSAMLQGLARCGKCGRRMSVSYGGHRSQRSNRTMQYRCSVARRAAAGPDCQLLGGKRIDALVIQEFLEVMTPAAIEAAQNAGGVLQRDREEEERHWNLRIEKASYEAQRAERQFHAVEPENRQVARQLERRWNERLVELEEVRARAQAAQTQLNLLSAEELERVVRLGSEIQDIWNAETTLNRDKKRLLRCAIEEVQLTAEDERYLIRIVWKGGVTTDRYIVRYHGAVHATSEDIIDLVRKLAIEFDDAQIARVLSKQGRKSGLGNPFTKSSVMSMRGRHRIPMCKTKLVKDPREGPFNADEAAAQLGVCMSTIHRWLRDGVLAGNQVTPGAPWRIPLTDEVRQRLVGGDAPPSWVGLSEAGRLLGVPKQHVAYLVGTGKLKAMRTKVGNRGCWRIDVSSARSPDCSEVPNLFDQMENDCIKGS